jgi:hypothetical protein
MSIPLAMLQAIDAAIPDTGGDAAPPTSPEAADASGALDAASALLDKRAADAATAEASEETDAESKPAEEKSAPPPDHRARLAKLVAKMEGERAALKTKEQGLLARERQLAELESRHEPFLKAQEAAKAGDLETAMDLLGLDYDAVTRARLSNGTPEAKEAAFRAELAKERAAREALEKSIGAEKAAAAAAAATARAESAFSALLTPETTPHLAKFDRAEVLQEAHRVADRWLKAGEPFSLQDVADHLESRVALAARRAAPPPAPPKPASPTIRSGDAAPSRAKTRTPEELDRADREAAIKEAAMLFHRASLSTFACLLPFPSLI